MDNPPDDFDVVVIAGDIDVPLTRSLQWVHDRFAGVPTIVVPGNHEYFVLDGEEPYTMTASRSRTAAQLADRSCSEFTYSMGQRRRARRHSFPGRHPLDRHGERWLGGTLHHVREAAGPNGMNDYKKIKRFSSATPGKRSAFAPQVHDRRPPEDEQTSLRPSWPSRSMGRAWSSPTTLHTRSRSTSDTTA